MGAATGTARVERQAPAGAIARAMALLGALAAADGPCTVSELAAELGLPRPTVHRLLNLLRELGIVAAPNGPRVSYDIGLELFRIAALVTRREILTELALPIMRRVVEETGETCLLGVWLPADARMMFVAQVASAHPLGYRVEMHVPNTVAWGASGRAILAHRPPADVERVLASAERSPVSGVPQDEDALARQLGAVRAMGCACTRAEKIADSRGIAAPILGVDGWALGSLCLTIPEVRYRADTQPALIRLVVAHAAELSRAFGHRADQRPVTTTAG